MATLLMANTSNVKEMKGGRPQTVLLEETKPNCTIVTLGDTMEDTARELDHVHAVEFLTDTNEVVGKWLIVAPEINVQQYRKIDNQIGKFLLEADETYTAYQLQKLDRIEYSDGYFTSIEGLNVGDFVEIDSHGKFAKDEDGSDSTSPFRVISITELWHPIVMGVNASAKQPLALKPVAPKMIKLEVVR